MKGSSSKKRVVVLGGGAHTIPNYRAMLKLLAIDYELTILSEFYLGSESNVDQYKIYSVPKIKISRLREVLYFLLVMKFFVTNQVDIIHSHSTFPSGFMAILVKKIFRIPVVVCLNAGEVVALEDIQFGELLNSKRSKINRWVISSADAVTVMSQIQRDQVKQNLGVDREILLIPRGVIFEKYFRKRNSIERPVHFLNVAYIHPVKDHETLLRSFQLILQHTTATLTIVGEDYENKKIHKLAKELSIANNVYFVGPVEHDSIKKYYQDADILLHTSRYEGLPTVALEALASGMLVCGSHVGILADLSEKCCITVAPKDFKTLAEKVLDLLNSTSLQNKLREAAIEWSNQHSLSWTVEQYKMLYNKMLKQ